MDIKPIGEVFHDKQEMRASHFLDEFKTQKVKDPELLNKAATEFEQSSNPEGKEIASMLKAWYLREKGKVEPDDEKACTYLIKSSTAFGRDKRSKRESQQIMLEFYARKLEICHTKRKNPTDIFYKRANIYKELGREKEYFVEMSLFTLYKATNITRDLKQAVTLLEEAVKYADKS